MSQSNRQPIPQDAQRLIDLAIAEDFATRGDITSKATIDSDHVSTATVVVRESLILSGISLAKAVYLQIDETVAFNSDR